MALVNISPQNVNKVLHKNETLLLGAMVFVFDVYVKGTDFLIADHKPRAVLAMADTHDHCVEVVDKLREH